MTSDRLYNKGERENWSLQVTEIWLIFGLRDLILHFYFSERKDTADFMQVGLLTNTLTHTRTRLLPTKVSIHLPKSPTWMKTDLWSTTCRLLIVETHHLGPSFEHTKVHYMYTKNHSSLRFAFSVLSGCKDVSTLHIRARSQSRRKSISST